MSRFPVLITTITLTCKYFCCRPAFLDGVSVLKACINMRMEHRDVFHTNVTFSMHVSCDCTAALSHLSSTFSPHLPSNIHTGLLSDPRKFSKGPARILFLNHKALSAFVTYFCSLFYRQCFESRFGSENNHSMFKI